MGRSLGGHVWRESKAGSEGKSSHSHSMMSSAMTYYLQRSPYRLVDTRSHILNIPAIQSRHRDPSVTRHVDVSSLNHRFASFRSEPRETEHSNLL